ncbi:hypothetical protein DFH06DRAFT_1148418 [Mycena polygramma]|nr:hypothetical protein DFH06DRAFT_1148418 [Mycena polygramma]
MRKNGNTSLVVNCLRQNVYPTMNVSQVARGTDGELTRQVELEAMELLLDSREAAFGREGNFQLGRKGGGEGGTATPEPLGKDWAGKRRVEGKGWYETIGEPGGWGIAKGRGEGKRQAHTARPLLLNLLDTSPSISSHAEATRILPVPQSQSARQQHSRGRGGSRVRYWVSFFCSACDPVMHGRRRSPTEGTERRTSPGTQGKGRGMSETVGGNRAELGLEGMDQSRTKGKVQAWAKSIEERPKPRGQDFGGSTEVGEEIRSSTNQASDSDRHQEGDATGRAIGPRTQSIAERRRTEGGVGEKREEGNREMRTYCTKAAVSGTSLYGSRPRPRVSARPEGEERRWLPEPDTGEGEGCGCIGTPRVTIAGTSLYGSRPHPQGAELWSAEHREAGRLLRRSSVRDDLGTGIPEEDGSQSQEYDQAGA